jgi:hypothetical protein
MPEILDLTVTDTLKTKAVACGYGNIDDAKARLEFHFTIVLCVKGLMYGLRILVGIQGNTILL